MSAEPPRGEEYRRALVEEALTRTPRGGFPELEQREGLRPGTLFDWVKMYGPQWEAPFSSLHFWIGTSRQTEEEFWRYVDHAESYWDYEVEEVEKSDRDLTGCGFCIDNGMRFLYDEDLLQVIWFDEPTAVRTLIDDSTLATDAATDIVVRACEERGITTANAGLVYADPTFVVPHPSRLFNELTYVGRFRSTV